MRTAFSALGRGASWSWIEHHAGFLSQTDPIAAAVDSEGRSKTSDVGLGFSAYPSEVDVVLNSYSVEM